MKHENIVRNLIKVAKERKENSVDYYYDAFDMDAVEEIEQLSSILEKEGYETCVLINEQKMSEDTPKCGLQVTWS